MKKLSLTFLLLLSFTFGAEADRRVKGEYTYYAEASESVAEAKQKALEGAKIEALAREFGTIISQSNFQSETSRNGQENTYFSSLSETEVKGEWLQNTGEPEYDISYAGGLLIVKCSVAGRAREISNEASDFRATVLRNGTEARFADVSFRDGDDMYLLFQAPKDGYVAVYLIDENNAAFCLLPYMEEASGQQPVRHGREYVFFSSAKGSGPVDEYTLTCDKDIERNRLYVIFSPKPFTKAVDMHLSEALPRQLSYESFQRWLGALRKRDTAMGVKEMHIEIKK